MEDETKKELENMKLTWKLFGILGGICGILFIYFVTVNAGQWKEIGKKSDKTEMRAYNDENKQEHKEIKVQVSTIKEGVNEIKVDVKGIETEVQGLREDIKEIKDLIKRQ